MPSNPPQTHSIKASAFGAGHRCCFVSRYSKPRLSWLSNIMVALFSFVALLLLALLARTSPAPVELAARGRVYSHPQRAQYGVSASHDVTRFVVKYANARRWEPSTAVSLSQGPGLLQQVSTPSSHLVRPSLMSPICRTSPLPAPSPTQIPHLRTAFIWLSMFLTPSVPVATLLLSSGPFSTSLPLVTHIHFPQDSWWIIHERFCERPFD